MIIGYIAGTRQPRDTCLQPSQYGISSYNKQLFHAHSSPEQHQLNICISADSVRAQSRWHTVPLQNFLCLSKTMSNSDSASFSVDFYTLSMTPSKRNCCCLPTKYRSASTLQWSLRTAKMHPSSRRPNFHAQSPILKVPAVLWSAKEN